MSEKKNPWRPSLYDRELVRDISVQVMIAFYNDNPDVLQVQIKKDPDYVAKMRAKAVFMDKTTTLWLTALDVVGPGKFTSAEYRYEVMFAKMYMSLEPPHTRESLDRKPEVERKLRYDPGKHLTDWHWRVNCKRWIEAIQRVRTDNGLSLLVPSTVSVTTEEDEDDYV